MGRLRIPLAVLAAVAVAEVLVLVFRPRTDVIEPVRVNVEAYFSAAQVQRAQDFRDLQFWLYAGTVGLQAGVLAGFVARPPRRWRRPLLGAAAVGATLSLAMTLAPLPVRVVMRERAKDVGLVTQAWPGYLRDTAISAGIGAVLMGAGAAAGVALIRRLPRGWWLPGAGVIVVFGALSLYAGPIVLDPLFNKFRELPAGQTRDDVLALAREAGVDVGDVLVMDASRRTTAANAYVAGLGHTKRVVLYDTLLDNFSRDQVRLVVAHELGHVHFRDVPRGLLFFVLVAVPGSLAARTVFRRLDRSPVAGPHSVPALAAALLLIAVPVGVVANQLSREVEARADGFSLRLTGETRPFIGWEREIALRNVADPDPPAWRTFLIGTHPPILDRIGAGVAYERRQAAGGS